MGLDCYQFYLWSIGQLPIPNESELSELLFQKEEK
jgi:hypothetical protein